MAPEHATARWLQRVARALQLRDRKHSSTDSSQQLCSAKCPSLTLALANSAPRRQGRGARAPHLYLYTPVDLPCYIPLRAFCARKPMLRHALVPRVSASLHRLALTYNHKPVVDPLLLQNLPPRGRSGPYPIPSGSNGAAAASLTGFSYPITAVFSTAARRRIRNDAY